MQVACSSWYQIYSTLTTAPGELVDGSGATCNELTKIIAVDKKAVRLGLGLGLGLALTLTLTLALTLTLTLTR